jgi:hypothetical protein
MSRRLYEAHGFPAADRGAFIAGIPLAPRTGPAFAAYKTRDGRTEIVTTDDADPQWARWSKNLDEPIAFSENSSPEFRALAQKVRAQGN